jgi:hypothetical protein
VPVPRSSCHRALVGFVLLLTLRSRCLYALASTALLLVLRSYWGRAVVAPRSCCCCAPVVAPRSCCTALLFSRVLCSCYRPVLPSAALLWAPCSTCVSPPWTCSRLFRSIIRPRVLVRSLLFYSSCSLTWICLSCPAPPPILLLPSFSFLPLALSFRASSSSLCFGLYLGY